MCVPQARARRQCRSTGGTYHHRRHSRGVFLLAKRVLPYHGSKLPHNEERMLRRLTRRHAAQAQKRERMLHCRLCLRQRAHLQRREGCFHDGQFQRRPRHRCEIQQHHLRLAGIFPSPSNVTTAAWQANYRRPCSKMMLFWRAVARCAPGAFLYELCVYRGCSRL